MSADLPAWIVFRYDMQRDGWHEVGSCSAADAGAAFRHVVLPAPGVDCPPLLGQYRILSLEGSAHFGVELNLRDLDAEKAAKA